MIESFDPNDNGPWEKAQNFPLAWEKQQWIQLGISYFPVMLINDFTFRGDLEADEVLTALCAGFKEPPEKCNELLKQVEIKKGKY